MTIYPQITDIPKNTTVRGPWIVFRLRLIGSSIKAVAEAQGVTPQAVSMAVTRADGAGSSERLERAVAEALHLPVWALFGERYDQRTHKRARPSRAKRTARPQQINVEVSLGAQT